MLQLGQIPSSIMLYLPQLCFKSQQHWILASVDFLLLCLLVTVFRHSGMSRASRTTAVVQSVPAKERLATRQLSHCTIHHVVQNSTIGKKLWLWYYGFHGYKRGEGAAQLRVCVINYLAFYNESFYTPSGQHKTHHLHCRDVFAREGICCVTD